MKKLLFLVIALFGFGFPNGYCETKEEKMATIQSANAADPAGAAAHKAKFDSIVATQQRDTDVPVSAPEQTWWEWLLSWKLVLVPILWEIVFRVFPTWADLSLVNLIKRLLDYLLGNKGLQGKTYL